MSKNLKGMLLAEWNLGKNIPGRGNNKDERICWYVQGTAWRRLELSKIGEE